MRHPNSVIVFASLLSVLPGIGVAQVAGPISQAAPGATPRYAWRPPVKISSLPAGYAINSLVFDAKTGAVISGAEGKAVLSSNLPASAPLDSDDQFDVGNVQPDKPTVDGLDTLATFDEMFAVQSGPLPGQDVRFTMIGNDPRKGGTTEIPANIDEVSLELLKPDGSVFKTVSYAPFEQRTLESPNFEPRNYDSGSNEEYADAAQRAEFWDVMKYDWHTLLIPSVVSRVTIQVPFYEDIQLPNGNIVPARTYFTGKAADGQTYVLLLDYLFNPLADNEVFNEIELGNFTTNGVNIMLFPNTYLFSLNVNDPGVPGVCCTLGSHTYFLQSGFPELRWVIEFASWISPGVFPSGFEDVVALSHETAEVFDDPFLDNVTPNWQYPGVPANVAACGGYLEVGDPIAMLPKATAIATVSENGFKYVYHPQNVALYQWFEMGTSSSALHGAFSFPDATVLPHSALPCPQ